MKYYARRCSGCQTINGELTPEETTILQRLRLRTILGTGTLSTGLSLHPVAMNRLLKSMAERGLIVRGERAGNPAGGWEYLWSIPVAGPEAPGPEVEDAALTDAIRVVLPSAKMRLAQCEIEGLNATARRLRGAIATLEGR
jgi:hypothetical protein